MEQPPEIPLKGGRITYGVVRVGETVRRPPTPSSLFVESVLGLLEKAGFEGAPRHLGQDESGRDIFTYIPGAVPEKWQAHADATIEAFGRLLRQFHDATRDSLAVPLEVVCHHDPGPNNVVFRNGTPIAFIDFDTAAPGDPLEDLAYAAWSWCISSKLDRQPAAHQSRQVRLLTEAYRATAEQRRDLIDAVLASQAKNLRFWLARKALAKNHLDASACDAMMDWTEREQNYVDANRSDFLKFLK